MEQAKPVSHSKVDISCEDSMENHMKDLLAQTSEMGAVWSLGQVWGGGCINKGKSAAVCWERGRDLPSWWKNKQTTKNKMNKNFKTNKQKRVGSVYSRWPQVSCEGKHSKPFGSLWRITSRAAAAATTAVSGAVKCLTDTCLSGWYTQEGGEMSPPLTSFSEDKNMPRGTMTSFRNSWKWTLNQIRGLKAEICYLWANLAGVIGHIHCCWCCWYCTPEIRLWHTSSTACSPTAFHAAP